MSSPLKELRARWESYTNNTPYEPEGNVVHEGSLPWWPDLDSARDDVRLLLDELDKARGILREHQYQGDDFGPPRGMCVECCAANGDPCEPDCALSKVLE
jgi:hypothetical protein